MGWGLRKKDSTGKGLSSKKGFVLITSILSTSILIIMTMPYVSRVATEYRLMTKIYNSTSALDLAEAGVERALWEIRYNNKTFAGWTNVANPETHTIAVNSFTNSAGSVMGDYDVSVSISSDGMTSTVTATGYVPNRIRTDVKRTVKVVYSKHNFAMTIRAQGDGPGAITLGVQDKVDSYNSALGTYAATHSNTQGNIATNGSIVFGTQASVYGDARPGEDYPFTSQPSNVSGAWGTLQAPLVIDPIPDSTIAAAQATISNNDNSNIQKGYESDPDPLIGYALVVGTQKSVTLPGGTYYFTSISLSTQATLNVTGPSTINVEGGDVSVGTQTQSNMIISASAPTVIYMIGGNLTVGTQGGLNNGGAPRNLTIYSTGSSISFTTQTNVCAAIYAPNAAVTLTTQGDIYGAVACRTFTGGTQAGMHFDLDLLNVSPVFSDSGVESWQEIY